MAEPRKAAYLHLPPGDGDVARHVLPVAGVDGEMRHPAQVPGQADDQCRQFGTGVT
ncbi:hypothetical protein GCM10022214_67510 [Actinomadura miaoliensis]|uniref:Uncharacterized protein n=1 Tax=Actinomadura miaoliensis TaxID=430685 RepID=A0ABP7WS54_9ACTN